MQLLKKLHSVGLHTVSYQRRVLIVSLSVKDGKALLIYHKLLH